MALAILRPAGGADPLRFRFDLGSNRFYAWAIGPGDGEGPRPRGVGEPSARSPVLGPLPEAALGRGELEIPAGRFDRTNRFLQLVSWRTADGIGPAVSDVLEVRPRLASEALPAIAFSGGPMAQAERRPVAFAYAERAEAAGFLDLLGGVAKQLLPVLAPIFAPAPAAAPGAAPGSPPAAVPGPLPADAVAAIAKLLQSLLAKGQSLPDDAVAAAQALPGPLASAQALPAALIPILQTVLTPETVKAVIESPEKLTGTVLNGLKELGQLGIQNTKQELDFLKSIQPSLEDAGLDRLLQGLSLAPADEAPSPGGLSYRRVPWVVLRFAGARPVPVGGRARVVYARGRDAELPLAIQTPRTIPSAGLQLLVRDPSTLEVLAERRQKLVSVAAGPIAPAPRLPREVVDALPAGREVLVTATLVFAGRGGERLGTSRSQLVSTAGAYLFERMGGEGRAFPLDDVERHRDWWHKVWQASFSDEDRSFDLECKYYYALEPDRDRAARMETVLETERRGTWGRAGRLKTGLAVALPALNALAAELPGGRSLDDDELEALRDPAFVERFHRAARTRAQLRGKRGESVALWVYPTVRLEEVVLKRASQVGPTGQIEAFEDHPVPFPIPATAHVVGTSTAP